MIEIIGDELWFQGHKIAEIRTGIPSTIRGAFDIFVTSINPDKEQELYDSIASLEDDLSDKNSEIDSLEQEIKELKEKIGAAQEALS